MQVIQKLAPSFNFPRPTITDGTDSVRPATLRSLGPDQVLVLINGKRRHTSALVHLNGSIGRGSTGVDLNAIPVSAIERIEVLRDGAAAQYGSDAIAGVINIVTRSGATPLTLTFKGGATTHSDGELLDGGANYGFRIGRGALNVTAEYRDRNATNRAGNDPRDQIRVGDGGNNAVPQPNHHWGDSDERDVMTFADLNVPVGVERDHVLLRLRRVEQARGLARRVLSARPRRAELAPDLSARLPAPHRAQHHRLLGHRWASAARSRSGSGTRPPSTATTASSSTSRTA